MDDPWARLGAEIARRAKRQFLHYMARCEDAWRAGSTLAVADAVSWCRIYQVPPPKWVDKAVQAAIVDRRTKAEEQRHYITKLHYLRWDIVADMRKRDRASSPRKHRLSWQRCYDAASDALAETEARGSPETIKKSYQAVQRDMREGRRAKYYIALR